MHLIKIWIFRCRTVEELSPKQLTMQRQRREGFLDLLVQVRQLVVEKTRREASKPVFWNL